MHDGWNKSVRQGESPLSHSKEVRLFGSVLAIVWGLLLFGTMVIELVPRDPTWLPRLFYPYTTFKGLLFVLLGFVTPLALWKFNSLGMGVLFAVATAGSVEGLQVFLPGHRASYLEFGAKLVLLMLGFVAALVARHDRRLKVGPLSIKLSDPHISRRE